MQVVSTVRASRLESKLEALDEPLDDRTGAAHSSGVSVLVLISGRFRLTSETARFLRPGLFDLLQKSRRRGLYAGFYRRLRLRHVPPGQLD